MRNILILISCVALYHTGCAPKKEHHLEDVKFVVTRPVEMDTIINKEYVCQIHSIRHIELRALERGYLQNTFVDEGQLVRSGQLMFQIMPRLYEAEVQKAQAEADFAEIEFRNTKSLADSGVVAPNELSMARARFDKAKAELALARVHLDFTRIRAPFDGIMDRLHVRKGSLLDEGELLTTLSDNSEMWVYFNVPEAEYLDYITGTNADNHSRVYLQMANNRIFDNQGIVETIEADFNNETGNIAFRATFPNPKRILRHGETGNVLMPIYLKDALVIPQKATFEILDKKYVFVVGSDGLIQSREIVVGTEMPHLYVVTDGLDESDQILVEGLRRVKNNQKIKYDYQEQRTILAGLNQLHAE